MEKLANGIWKITYGEPESKTPQKERIFEPKFGAVNEIAISKQMAIKPDEIELKMTSRGINVKLPMDPSEDIFGFGLQLLNVNYAGTRRYVKVNSDPPVDTGESHAPVPFFISTAGYGIYVDTYRYATFLMGTNTKKRQSSHMTVENEKHKVFSESALYALKKSTEPREIIIDIPTAEGIDIYIFEGNTKEIVQRYNLFSGGGCVPPMWGLGVWYRSYGGSDQDSILKQAQEFRQEKLPIDVLGLEPGWHSHSYACTYKWSDMFKEPEQMIEVLNEEDFKLNLWEHLFVYPKAPFYKALSPYSGDYEVWNGLVPDLGSEEAKKIIEDYHYEYFVEKGIMGFKLDECDNSDYNPSNWSFPDCTAFPSGYDGEQMHQAVGNLYQNSIYNIYKKANKRTFSQVRASGALSASLPFVLYSDLYNHQDFIRGNVTAGFSGLLWCPEVRDCVDNVDLLRRVQSTVFSAQTLINAWRIPSPPWKQTDIEKNLKGEIMLEADDYTTMVRQLFELRMSLLPYLYSAFMKYHREGIPPIRSLVMDYPDDVHVRTIDNQYMFGNDLLVCPLVREDDKARDIYLPEGVWYNFFTHEKVVGGKTMTVLADYDQIPVYVRPGAIVPLAVPVECITIYTTFTLDVLVFGDEAGLFKLYEDDFYTFDYEDQQREIKIEKSKGEKLVKPANSDKYLFRDVKEIN